jgi:hypothetical protein
VSAHNTVLIKGRGIRKEFKAGAAGIMPGHLLTLNTSGQAIVHATAAGNAARLFAVENEVVGKEISDAYANGDNVIAEHLPSGAEVNAFVIANGAAIVIGDYLESGAAGGLRKTTANAATADTQRSGVIAQAMEAVDNSANGSQVRIRVALL